MTPAPVRLPDLSPLVGCIVGQLRFDNQVWLHLASHRSGFYGEHVDALLVIGGEFTVAGALVADHADCAVVLPLLHAEVTAVEVEGDQALTVTFTRNGPLHVPPDRHYEAWEIRGHGVENWIAAPT